MDAWLNIVVRQFMLYSLPLLVSLTVVSMVEAKACGAKVSNPFHAIVWRGCWLPFLAAIFLNRGVIVALPNPLAAGVRPALVRFLLHLVLTAVGFLLFTWSLANQAPVGLPPLHHWWAKVLMFFNLCMAALHLLPLPTLLAGELLSATRWGRWLPRSSGAAWIVVTVAVLTPSLDLFIGNQIIYPCYEWLSNLAAGYAG